jgi:branched-chain amino acid transport system substrate-binding protein
MFTTVGMIMNSLLFNSMRAIVLAFAIAMTAISTQAQIKIGILADLQGPVSLRAQENLAGAKLWFDSVNAKGGLYGKKIEIVNQSDNVNGSQSAINAEKLLQD